MGRDLLFQASLSIGAGGESLRPIQDNGYASIASWVWHYTGPSAVDSIFSTRRLWASHAGDLNDPGEIAYGRAVLQDAYHRMKAEDYYHASYASEQRRSRFAALGLALEVGHKGTVTPDYFLLCASSDFDVLNQWQHYGSNGYAIGLPANSPLAVPTAGHAAQGHGASTGAAPFKWRRVMYDQEEQLVYAATQIMTFVQDETPRLEPAANMTDDWLSYVEDFFAPTIGLMKHWRFSAERECRIIIANRTAEYDVTGGFMRVTGEQFREFRAVGGYATGPTQGGVVADLPLVELRLGPMDAGVRGRRLERVRRMLRLHGHEFFLRVPNTPNELADSADNDTAEASQIIGLSYSEIPYAPMR